MEVCTVSDLFFFCNNKKDFSEFRGIKDQIDDEHYGKKKNKKKNMQEHVFTLAGLKVLKKKLICICERADNTLS